MRISLDDIGQGNSNYQMIIDAHPDSFKIDRYFVAGCQCDPNRRAVINSVKKLADEMGANIIADGVEEREELDTLRSLGIELFQGYYLCIPRSVEQLIEMNADSSPGNFPWCGLVPEAAL